MTATGDAWGTGCGGRGVGFVAADDFGTFLRILRRRARLTQRELGLRVGYSEGHVCRLEQNRRVPEVSVITALFVPALGLTRDPAAAGRLLEFARQARERSRAGAGGAAEGSTSAALDAAPGIPAAPTHLVDRPAVLAGLRELLGAEPLVVLRGFAGTGKTTLAAQYARSRAADEGEAVCWITVTRGVSASQEALMRRLARQLSAQGRPGLATLVEPADGRPAPLERQAELLAAALAQRPTLVCLDNAHALTGEGALAAVAQLAAPAGVRLLLISKTSLDLPGAAFYRLDGLEPEPGLELVGRLDPDMPAPLAARLVAHTGGNPMLLRLALGQARQPGADRRSLVDGLAVNAEIGDYLLRTTLDELKPAGVWLAALLSVFRHPVNLYDEALAEQIQSADDSVDLLGAIGELRRRQLIDQPAAAALHPLVRGQIYARLVGDLGQRRRLHRLAAVWSEQARDSGLEAAWHFRQAGEDEQAVEVLTDRVRALVGHGHGLAAADIAGQLRDRLRRRAAPDGQLLWRVHVLTGDLLVSTTRWTEAEAAYRAALAVSGPPALWATVARRLAVSLMYRGQHEDALELCLNAAARLGPEDVLLRAEVTATQAQARLVMGGYDEARRLAEAALALAEELDVIAPEPADVVAATAGGTVGVVLGMQRRFDEAAPKLRAAIDRARRAGLTQIAARVQFNLAALHLDRGELAEPPPLLHAVAARMLQAGDEYGVARVQHMLAEIAHYRGECAQALALFDKACELKRQVGDAPGLANSETGRAGVLRSLGRIDEALDVHRRVVAESAGDADPRARSEHLDGYGLTLLVSGRISAARDQFRAAQQIAGADGQIIRLHSALADLLSGRTEPAIALAAQELPGRDARLDTRLDARLLRAAVALVLHDAAGLAAVAAELSDWIEQTGFALHRSTPDTLLALSTSPAPDGIARLLWVPHSAATHSPAR